MSLFVQLYIYNSIAVLVIRVNCFSLVSTILLVSAAVLHLTIFFCLGNGGGYARLVTLPVGIWRVPLTDIKRG